MTVIAMKNQEIWRTLNVLKQSIQHMKRLDPVKYSSAISKERRILREIIEQIVSQEAPSMRKAA